MRRVKNACVSSSAIPSSWSTQPSRVTLMLKVKSPMATSLLRVARTAGLRPVDEYLEAVGATSVRPHHLLPGIVRARPAGLVGPQDLRANFDAPDGCGNCR